MEKIYTKQKIKILLQNMIKIFYKLSKNLKIKKANLKINLFSIYDDFDLEIIITEITEENIIYYDVNLSVKIQKF